MQTARAVIFLLTLGALVASCGDEPAADAVSPIPDKTVVLTFDDGCRSQLTIVAPLLAEKGFGATFFATGAFMASEEFLDWEGLAAIHRMGFEIGNHTFGHHGYGGRKVGALLEREVQRVEEALAEVGVPKPVSFAWPAGEFGPGARARLERIGYCLARRGMEPEHPARTAQIGFAWDPSRQDRLLIPTTYVAHPNWTLEHFAEVVARARGGRPVVLQFHCVTDDPNKGFTVAPARFREFMDYLDREGYRCIAMRDLLPDVEGVTATGDRMLFTRHTH